MSDNQPQSGFDPMLVPAQPGMAGQAGPSAAGQVGPGDAGYAGPRPAPTTGLPEIDPRHDPMHPDFEDPYYDPSEWEPLRRRSPFLFRAAIVIGVIGFMLLTAYRFGRSWVDDRIDPPGEPALEVRVPIPSGATADDIARILAGEEVVSSSLVTSYYWRWNEAPVFQAGDYVFQTNSSVEEAQSVLEAGPLPPVFNGSRIVFPEGFKEDEIAGRMLDELQDFDPRELDTALDDGSIRSAFQPEGINSLEGLLFPATYEIIEDELTDERALVQKMVNTFDARARSVGLQNAQAAVGYSPYEVLIIASLIEKEARLDEDRAKIARVIYNRLEDGEKLQIDATVIYALGDLFDFEASGGVVTFADLEFPSPYNTYAEFGLPPGPIASPGEASLFAALFPEPGPWKFYVVIDDTGAHAFAETFDEHGRNIQIAEQNGVR